jgi:Carbonic anhydrases/acetyltransferases, isoleucine patch superfamily
MLRLSSSQSVRTIPATDYPARGSRANRPNLAIHPESFIHPGAYVIGNVTLGPQASVWPTAVLRGDTDAIVIGEGSNVQDGAIIHVEKGLPTIIGKRTAIGHRAVVHGSRIEDDVLIGMGAIVLNGAHIGSGSLIAAGAVVREGMVIPPNSLVVGVPGRIVRETTDAERERIKRGVAGYWQLQLDHAAGMFEQQ